MKHKFFSKRGLALVVSVMMCLSAMSTTAWAGSFKDLQDKIGNAGDSFTLDDDYAYNQEKDGDTTTITIDEKFTLDLGGHKIDGNNGANNNSVITVTGTGDLTLQGNGTITGGAGAGANEGKHEGGGVIVKGNGKFTMDGGTITGNTAANRGGGVYVEKDAEFTMNGGTITKNTTNGDGGGVAVWGGGKFTMNDGSTISNNTAGNSGGGVHTAYASGAGKGATFTMNGGTISGNKTTNGGDYGGGGVYVTNGDFTMYNGNITGNTSAINAGASDTGASGGGVYMNGGTFTMENGTISENNANGTGEGGGIYGKGGATITMNNGNITGNTASSTYGGGGVRVYGAKFTMNNGTLTGNTANNAASDLQSIAAAKDESDPEKTEAFINAGTVGADAERFVESICQHKDNTAGVITVCKEHSWTGATCTQKATCSACGAEGAVDPDVHNLVDADDAKTATCTEAGQTASKVCTWCKQTIEKGTPMGINPDAHEFGDAWESDSNSHWHVCTHSSTHTSEREAHNWGDWSEWSEPDANNNQTQTRTCNVCGAEDVRNQTVTPTPGGDDDNTGDTDTEDPGTVVIPDPDVPLGDEPAPAVTIADEDVPLAGLVTLAQLLDELYRHEGAPEVHIPDGFPFADHEYAEAICWGLDNALVFHTEEEPLDPDEIVTVGLMREVLTNFVAYRGVEEFTVELAGADDEIVMDLGERLVVFYAQLAEAEAAAETDETEAA